MSSSLLFFFQAEDGIRDLTVTGVQTCALPISTTSARSRRPTASAGRWPRSTSAGTCCWRRVFAFSPFTVWFNLTGQPAIVLPLGRSGTGLPVAVQLVARAGDEGTLFRLASGLETARPWLRRGPALPA